MYQRQSLLRRQRDLAAGLHHHPAPRSDRHDVQIEILFCGICHSDLHYGPQRVAQRHAHRLPLRARATRSSAASRRSAPAVTKFKAGDLAGVGCLVDSDRTCPNCQAGLEQFCPSHGPHLQLPRQAPAAASPTAATPTASSSTSASSCACPPTSTSPAPRRCSAPASRPTRRCATGASPRARRSASSASAGSGHMGVKFAHALRRPRRRLHHLARQEGGRAAPRRRRGRRLPQRRRDEEARRQLRLHPRRRRPPSTTSTPTSTCSRRDGNLTLVGAPEKPLPVVGLRPDLRPPQPLRLAHRRHRRDPGDARLLRRSTTSPPTSRSSRSRRSTRPTSGCSSPT